MAHDEPKNSEDTPGIKSVPPTLRLPAGDLFRCYFGTVVPSSSLQNFVAEDITRVLAWATP